MKWLNLQQCKTDARKKKKEHLNSPISAKEIEIII